MVLSGKYEAVEAIAPHFLTKMRDAHISCQITDLGKYGKSKGKT